MSVEVIKTSSISGPHCVQYTENQLINEEARWSGLYDLAARMAANLVLRRHGDNHECGLIIKRAAMRVKTTAAVTLRDQKLQHVLKHILFPFSAFEA